MKKYQLSFFYKGFTKTFVSLLLATALLLTACNSGGNKSDTASRDSTATKNSGQSTNPPDPKRAFLNDTGLVTIAAMNDTKDGKDVEVLFYEREAVYTISKSSDAYRNNADALTDALKRNLPVKLVSLSSAGVIANITKASEAEIRFYNSGDGFNSPKMKIAGAPNVAVDVTKLDTAKFDRVENQLKFPVFRLCNNVVPSYAKLVEIFNYCAAQGCNNPPPYTITNCIPFQYVRDGCFARAHKMRQMITTHFGYCCEKVFSYGTPNPTRLAVKASKWGGCCVTWWYHVAPLLRLNLKFGSFTFQICYVIDPGMFNGPVTLSTWLAAQKDPCYANANVTSYSIQPGSAYTPAGGGYSTDNNYVKTELDLIFYNSMGATCP